MYTPAGFSGPLDLRHPEMPGRSGRPARDTPGHGSPVTKHRVRFEDHHHAPREGLGDNTFETHETAQSVVLDHPNPRSTSEVQVAQAIGWSLGGLTRLWVVASFASEGGISEIGHGLSFTTSWNW
jgi:hypothetical protein